MKKIWVKIVFGINTKDFHQIRDRIRFRNLERSNDYNSNKFIKSAIQRADFFRYASVWFTSRHYKKERTEFMDTVTSITETGANKTKIDQPFPNNRKTTDILYVSAYLDHMFRKICRNKPAPSIDHTISSQHILSGTFDE